MAQAELRSYERAITGPGGRERSLLLFLFWVRVWQTQGSRVQGVCAVQHTAFLPAVFPLATTCTSGEVEGVSNELVR